MALANDVLHIQSGFASRALARIIDALHLLAERRAQRRIYRQTRRELMELSNRALDDLGLSRSMIESVAREAAGY